MWGIRYIWGWLIAFILLLSANARNAIIGHGRNLWQVARGIAEFAVHVSKRWTNVTAWLLLVAVILVCVGLVWTPAKLVAIVILVVWFGVTVLVLRAIANTLGALPAIGPFKNTKGEITVPEIPLAGIGDAIASALRLGSKPILWALAVLASLGLQVLAFPGLKGLLGITVGLVGFLTFVGWTAANTYRGRPAGTLRVVYVFIMISILAFTIRVIPNANNFLAEHTRSVFMRIGSSSSGRSVRNEPFARFAADRYLFQLGLTDKTAAPIFTADGQPLDATAKGVLLKELDDKLVIVLDAKVKPPKAMKVAGIEFAKIQNPAGTMGQYIVPRRCIDLNATNPVALEVERYKDNSLRLYREEIKAKRARYESTGSQ